MIKTMSEPTKTTKEERYEKAYRALQKAFIDVKGIQNIKAQLVPFNHTVLIKKMDTGDNQTTAGGILLAQTSSVDNIKPNMGVIVAVGPECSELCMVGLTIAYNQFANLEVFMKGDFYHIIHEDDIHFAVANHVPVMMDGLTDKEKGGQKRSKQDKLASEIFKKRDEEFKDKIDFNLGKH